MKVLKIILSLMITLTPLTTITTIAIQAQENVPNLQSPSVLAIDSENGQVLYQVDSDQAYEVGSITKLLTVYTALDAFADNSEWTEETVITISDNAYQLSQNYNLSNVPLRQDEEYTIWELIESVAVNLANGSTLALAEFIAEDEAAFLDLMEAQLQEWGITDYNLINVTGLPRDIDSGPINTFTAEAAAVIAYHLVNDYPQYLEYSGQERSVFKPGTRDRIEMLNYNQHLAGKPYEVDGVEGLMPGYSTQDGASFVGYTERDNFGVITVVLGAVDEDIRYDDSTLLIDYIYAAYRKESVIQANQATTQVGVVPIRGGTLDQAPLVYRDDLSLVVPLIDTTPRLEYVFTLDESALNEQGYLEAPVDVGTQVGVMTISGVDAEVTTLPSTKGNNVPVVLEHAVEEAPWYQQTWQSVTSSVSNAWESTRKFFVDLFN